MLKYTDITQNTYVQSGTVTEIMTRKSVVFLWVHTLYLLAYNVTPVGRECSFVRRAFSWTVGSELHSIRNPLCALHTQFSLRLL